MEYEVFSAVLTITGNRDYWWVIDGFLVYHGINDVAIKALLFYPFRRLIYLFFVLGVFPLSHRCLPSFFPPKWVNQVGVCLARISLRNYPLL